MLRCLPLTVFLAVLLCGAVGCTTKSDPPTKPDVTSPQPNGPPPVADQVEEETGNGPSNSPVSLTASDGTGLKIVSFEAKAVVQDPLAFTELHIVFQNPEARQLEGQFSITLPTSATVSRFAMKQAWGWQEGEVVELQAARRAYEDFLHRRQDPALMEKQPGNEFHARVFPIAPSATKEIIISYSEELQRAGEPYRVHLRGLPRLDKLDVHAIVARRQSGGPASSMGGVRVQNEVIEVHKQAFTPDIDFTVGLPPVTQQPQAGLRNGELVVARITPVGNAPADPVTGLHVLFDTSASRALGYARSIEKLGALVAVMAEGGKDKPLKVSAFDQDLVVIYEGTLGGLGKDALAKLTARRALGASNLAAALAGAAKAGGKYPRMLLVTDGIATAGDTDAAALKLAVTALAQAGVQRLDAVVEGGIRDADRLADLVTAGLPHDGVVLEGNRTPATISRRLSIATVPRLDLKVPGATWVWPTQVKGLQPGDQMLVYAALTGQTPLVIDLDVAGANTQGLAAHMSYPVQVAEVERPLLERASVSAQIHRLESERAALGDADKSEALRKQEIALSTKFRVLCDQTALLVLESEEDYARFQIDRRALSDILTVGQTGIELQTRHLTANANLPTIEAPRPTDEDESFTKGKAKKDALGARDGVQGGDVDEKSVPSARAESGSGAMADPRGGGGTSASAAPVDEPAMPTAAPAIALPSPGSRPESIAGLVRSDDSRRESSRRMAAPLPSRPNGNENMQGGLAEQPAPVDPYTGPLKEVMILVDAKKLLAAEQKALAWRDRDAGDVLALIALGEVWEKKGDAAAAARAYGSIIDLFPGRADLRRFAGERLEHLGEKGLTLAIDTFKKARDQRPDHPASHRLLAYALLRAGQPAEAFAAIRDGSARSYPEGRFRGVDRILKEDVGLIAAAWRRQEPKMADAIAKSLAAAGASMSTEPSLRFVLNWETDANDVDFHIFDAQGGHAFFSQPHLPSGGDLYADVTTGYGPECFTIPGKARTFPYRLQAHYYSRGPMGYGMGKLEIIEHDGQGNLKFEERPFVIMVDHAFVDLGKVPGALR